jgi:hypothetical protein
MPLPVTWPAPMQHVRLASSGCAPTPVTSPLGLAHPCPLSPLRLDCCLWLRTSCGHD